MPVPIEECRCWVCRQTSLRRVKRPFEYEISHDGRPPVRIFIPDLEVTVCTNPDCRPDHPNDTILHDDAATWRITVETYRQLGLLTPAEIREKRRALGLSQQQLQELLGLGGNSLSRWEKGRVYQSRAMDRFLRAALCVPEVRQFLSNRSIRGSFPHRHDEPTACKFKFLGVGEHKERSVANESRRKIMNPAEAFVLADERHK